MECPAQRMFARHRLGLPDVCLNELALRHMTQPAADHFPVGRYAEQALHQEGIEIEDDRAADPNQRGPEDDVGCVHHTAGVCAARILKATSPPTYLSSRKPKSSFASISSPPKRSASPVPLPTFATNSSVLV